MKTMKRYCDFDADENCIYFFDPLDEHDDDNKLNIQWASSGDDADQSKTKMPLCQYIEIRHREEENKRLRAENASYHGQQRGLFAAGQPHPFYAQHMNMNMMPMKVGKVAMISKTAIKSKLSSSSTKVRLQSVDKAHSPIYGQPPPFYPGGNYQGPVPVQTMPRHQGHGHGHAQSQVDPSWHAQGHHQQPQQPQNVQQMQQWLNVNVNMPQCNPMNNNLMHHNQMMFGPNQSLYSR